MDLQQALNTLKPLCYIMCESGEDTAIHFVDGILKAYFKSECTEQLRAKCLAFIHSQRKVNDKFPSCVGSVCCRDVRDNMTFLI